MPFSPRESIPVFAVCLLAACGQPPAPEPATLRLVDLFEAASVEGGSRSEEPLPRSEWRFDGEAESGGPLRGWQAGPGVEGLTVRAGRLAGRTTGEVPVVHVERTSELDEREVLHAVEIKLRASAGSELGVTFSGQEELELGSILGRAKIFGWTVSAPLVPGDEPQLYTLQAASMGGAVTAGGLRHVVVRPTDAAGADFEIESLRLVFRSEYLASVPAGVGWHGLSNVYRETLVSRAGERVRFDLTLPQSPRLDLALGSIDDWPVTFRVAIGDGSGDLDPLLERTVTSADRWHPASADLSAYAGQPVTLELRVDSQQPGALGFWGAPAVRAQVSQVAEAERPQGVIFIVGDTLRRDHLDFYGYPRATSPNLSRLAAEGAVAEDCISQATWTKASVPSIMTSLYPTSHGVQSFNARLPASAETLAEVFRGAGYATVGMSSIPFTGRFTNLHQGYEEFHERASLADSENSKTAREYADRLIAWLERHRDVPFFAFFHVADPHSPYFAPSPHDTLWGEPGDPAEYRRQQEEVRQHIEEPLMQRFGMPTRGELAAAGLDAERYVGYELDAYDASIRAMDVEIGRILERLRELGLEERTLIAFVSDHGTEFLDHDRHFHGHSVYGELNRVPLLLWGPGSVPPGVRISPTVQTIDLMPTVLELAGLPAPETVQGQSLVPFFEVSKSADLDGLATAARAGGEAGQGSAWRRRPAFTAKASQDLRRDDPESYAVVSDGWKLIHNVRRPEGMPEFELYDHRADPLNLDDLAAEHPERVEQLAAKIAAWRERTEAERLVPDSELAEDMSAEELERLRSLGYL